MALSHHPHSSSTPSIRFDLNRSHKLSSLLKPFSLSPKGFRFRPTPSLSLHCRNSKTRFLISFAASHDDSKQSEVEVEKEISKVDAGVKASQEEWERMLESFKEQTVKMQGMSKEAYEVYSKKAAVILNETSKKLKIQAEKASQDLSVIAQEITKESKEYLSEAAKNSPEDTKDIVETLASLPDLKEVSQVRDYHLGIPYGIILSLGGFLSFMITGSTSAIRFGLILGSALLYLSVMSLRARNRQESSVFELKGQTAIAGVIFLRELRLVFQRPALPSFITTLVSGAMVAFYLYRIMIETRDKGSSLETGPES
ncbi:hypothetical protein ACHQM5_004586 [Ranunculus cassubicifolius]